MNVLFAYRAIDGIAGGIERMITRVMNEMVVRGHTVSFLTWDEEGAQSFYSIDDRIAWHKLNMGHYSGKAGSMLRIRRAGAVRKIVRKIDPQLIVCFSDGPFMAMRAYAAGLGVPVIVAERNAPTRFEHLHNGISSKVSYASFHTAARVLIQVEGYRKHYPASLHKRITTIPNPVMAAPRDGESIHKDAGRLRLLSVGRLSYQKNYPALVAAFAQIAGQHPNWDLVVVGEGEDRAALERQIAESPGLTGRVQLAGASQDVHAWYRSADLFCLASRWEGFPNALGEALSHGIASVGYAGCAGVSDLIHDKQNGLLAAGNGDPTTLAEALGTLMASPQDRQNYGRAAIASVAEYEPTRIYSLWEKTLLECAKP